MCKVGAALLVFGIICFVMQLSIPGIILLVAGFVALLTAFWLHTKSIVNNQTRSSASVITASAISDEENQELYNLQHALNDFLLRFYDDAADPDNKLVQLRIDSKAYADLHEKSLQQRTNFERSMQRFRQKMKKFKQCLNGTIPTIHTGMIS